MADSAEKTFSPPKNPGPRTKLAATKKWTMTPNWFEVMLRATPAPCCHLFWHILRSTVGYHSDKDTFEASLADLQSLMHVSSYTISRWAHVLDHLAFIRYRPSGNGSHVSTFTIFPYGIPTEAQVTVACNGIASAVKHERENGLKLSAEAFAQLAYKHALTWRRNELRDPEAVREFELRGGKRGFVW
jgi:hypothetical protein